LGQPGTHAEGQCRDGNRLPARDGKGLAFRVRWKHLLTETQRPLIRKVRE